MPSLTGAEQGASVGSVGGPIGAAIGGLIGGLFSRQPGLSPEAKQLYDFQMGIANQLRDYSKSVPLSDPQEQANLAQMRGLMGQEQLNQRNQLYGDLSMSPSGALGNGSLPDFMRSITQQQTGARMALDQQQLMMALQRRREAMMQASEVANNALGPAATQRMGGYNFAQLFGNIAQAVEYNKTRKPSSTDDHSDTKGGGSGNLLNMPGGSPQHPGGVLDTSGYPVDLSSSHSGALSLPASTPYGFNF